MGWRQVQALTTFMRPIDAAEPAATATVTVTMKLPVPDDGAARRGIDESDVAGRGVTLDVTVDVRDLLARLGAASSGAEAELRALSSADPPAAARALVGRTVADVERELILETLQHCTGNRTHAANVLGISIRTLRNKLHQYSIDGFAVPPVAGLGGG